MKSIDMTGERYGRLTVVRRGGVSKSGNAKWICACECGNVVETTRSRLIYGTSRSCGCLRNELAAERLRKYLPCPTAESKTRLYETWTAMKRRCSDRNCRSYPDYGGRGVSVCEDWIGSFSAFRDWAYANGYSDSLTIDRINSSGNYEPGNCRWATRSTQARNRRNNRVIAYKGETHCVFEWAEICGLRPHTLISRLNRGWDIGKSLNTPAQT